MTQTQQILTTLGFGTLTPMQEQTLLATKKTGGVVVLSPTGSGKTLAYLLPLTERVDSNLNAVQAVVVVPTRELASQSESVFKSLKTGIRSMALYGGHSTMEEHRRIREVVPQVIFVTPGRINDHVAKGNVNLERVNVVVLDEFDKCLELGFQAEMECLMSHLKSVPHFWLLSATDAEEIPQFMEKISKKHQKVNFLDNQEKLKERLEVRIVHSESKDKLHTLGQLLTLLEGKPAIVFVGFRESVERVGKWLQQQRFAAVMYHGGMEQDVRERALYKFRCGAANVLVSTDLAARGLDIPEVRVVIHYHLPLKEEDYTHRNGRTARWDAEGQACLLLSPTEEVPPYIVQHKDWEVNHVANYKPTTPKYTTLYIGRGKKDKLSKGDVLGFLCKKGGLKADEIGHIDVGAHHAYAAIRSNQAKQLLQQIGGEKIKGMKTLIEVMRH